MFFCRNCGNNIKSSNKQYKTSIRYRITGCPRWIYNIKCDCCNNRNDYRYFIEHKILFTPTLNNLCI